MRRIAWVALASALLGPSAASAEEEVVYERHKLVDFGDDLVDACSDGPDTVMSCCFGPSLPKRPMPFRVRQEFKLELLQTRLRR